MIIVSYLNVDPVEHCMFFFSTEYVFLIYVFLLYVHSMFFFCRFPFLASIIQCYCMIMAQFLDANQEDYCFVIIYIITCANFWITCLFQWGITALLLCNTWNVVGWSPFFIVCLLYIRHLLYINQLINDSFRQTLFLCCMFGNYEET